MKKRFNKKKVRCEECGWHDYKGRYLTAPNPFDKGEIITGCPQCGSVDSMQAVCDEPRCKMPVSCGTPTKDGYRCTCSKHYPNKRKGG